MVHHHIVALEAIHTPIPPFTLPAPHTHDFTSYLRTSPAELLDRVRDATIVINCVVRLDGHTLSPENTPNLQLIAVMASGTDCVDLDACRKRGIRVMNCPHANVEMVAEHAIGMYFAARRRTVMMHERTVGAQGSGGEWAEKQTLTGYMRVNGAAPMSCKDEVLGVVGYGAVGNRIANLAGLLGMKVLVSTRKNDKSTPAEGRTSFAKVLSTSTVLLLCLPRTLETMNLLSASDFAAMRPDAVLINVSRGGIVDEHALLEALKSGQIAGAATDVFMQEPAVGGKGPSSVLLGDDAKGLNLTVSPHVAWFGEKTMSNYQRLLKENIEQWAGGKANEENVVA